MPKGYGFLKKGNAYRTGLCRRLTHAEGKTLFVVTEKRTPIGLRAPKSILSKVFEEDRATRETRRAVVEKRDEATQEEFKDAILTQFPRIPEESVATILKHTLKKRSGRVGRTGTLTLDAKARLAVMAHVRHCHTSYDGLLKRKDVSKFQARDKVQADVVRVSREWRGDRGQEEQNLSKEKRKRGGRKQKPPKPQIASAKVNKLKGKVTAINATKNSVQKTADNTAKTTNRGLMRRRKPPISGPRTRSASRAHGEGEVLDHFFNDEDNPIIIDSSSEDSDVEGRMNGRGVVDDDLVDRDELDEYSDEFIVFDTDGDSDEEFELD